MTRAPDEQVCVFEGDLDAWTAWGGRCVRRGALSAATPRIEHMFDLAVSRFGDAGAWSDLHSVTCRGARVPMPLPSLHGTVLPPGRWPATDSEVEQLFVVAAPSHNSLRSDLWAAFRVWARLVHEHFGPSQVWLAGTLISHIAMDPDLHVAVLPRTPTMAERAITRGDVGLSLITLEDMLYGRPGVGGWLAAMKPIGGMLDAVLGSLGDQTALEALWSMGLTSRLRASASADVGYVSLEV